MMTMLVLMFMSTLLLLLLLRLFPWFLSLPFPPFLESVGRGCRCGERWWRLAEGGDGAGRIGKVSIDMEGQEAVVGGGIDRNEPL